MPPRDASLGSVEREQARNAPRQHDFPMSPRERRALRRAVRLASGSAAEKRRERIAEKKRDRLRKQARLKIERGEFLSNTYRKKLQAAGIDFGLTGAVGDEIGYAVRDVKNIAAGLPREAIEGAKATAKVVNPHSSMRERREGLGYFADVGKNFARGVEEIIPNPESLPYGDVSLIQIDDGDVDFWVRGGEKGDTARAGEAWKTRPVTSFLTGAAVVAPAASLGSVSRLARSIRDANPGLTRAQALKTARRENRNPGYAAAHGIEGGLKPRTLRSTVGDKTREVEVPSSRSALGRGYQGAADIASRAIPAGKPLSERKRANRAIAKAQEHAVKVENARTANIIAPVRKTGYTKLGRPKKREQALMTYALQTPKTRDITAGARAAQKALEAIEQAGGYRFKDADGYVWTGLSKHERESIRSHVDGLEQALSNPADPVALEEAVGALQEISRMTEDLGLYIATGRAGGVTPERFAKVEEGFRARRNLLAQRVGMEGEARGFYPHTAADVPMRPRGFQGATRRSGDVVGAPKAPSLNPANRLRLFQGGRLNLDPRALLTSYHQRLKFLWAEEQRRDLYDEGLDIGSIEKATPQRGYFIRDPDGPPAKLRPEQRSLLDPEQSAVQDALNWENKIDRDYLQALREWRESSLQEGRPGDWGRLPDDWKRDIEHVRWLPADVVEARIRPMFEESAGRIFAPTVGILNSLARLATIQGKPFRYVMSNTVQNVITAALTNPKGLARGMRNQAAMVRAVPVVDSIWRALKFPNELRSRRPDLYNLVVVETGDIPGTAGLPELARAVSPLQKAEKLITAAQHKLGSVEGAAADIPYRVGVWEQHAKRYGFETDDALQQLLTSDDPRVVRVRGEIRQRLRDDMLDFNRLTPFERENISRFFFIWPFVRASLRWPATYARDFPTATGVAVSQTAGEDYTGGVPTSARDLYRLPIGEGEFDAGFAIPYGPGVEKLEQAYQLGQGVTTGDISVIRGMQPPWLRTLIGGLAGYGSGSSGEFGDQLARQMLPGYAPIKDIVDEGVAGIPAVSRFTVKQGDDRLSFRTRERRDKDKETVNAALRKGYELGRTLPDQNAVQQSFDAWWLYQEYTRRAKFGLQGEGRTKATPTEKALILNKVARETYPSLEVHPDKTLRDAKDPATVEAYADWLYEQMFDARRKALAADNK